MKCLVTGGAGFIGSHLVDRLVELGHDVVVIDDFSLGNEDNIAAHLETEGVKIYRHSVCDEVDDIFEKEKFEVVFHLAAWPQVQYSFKDPLGTHYVNVNGTLNILQACNKHAVRRLVFSSSAAVYGYQTMICEEKMPASPLSHYALHKLIGEHYSKLFHTAYGLETINLRYFNVFGPRQSPQGDYSSLIPKFITLLLEGKRPTIWGNGENTRDFVYVGDVVEANIAAALVDKSKCTGETFNIASGQNYSVNKVARNLIDLVGMELEPVYGAPVIEIKDSLADISRAKHHLSWEPKTTFEEGLEHTFNFFKNKK